MTPSPRIPDTLQNILVITGEDLRHQYFVNQLNAQFSLAAVLIEASHHPSPAAVSVAEKEAWDWFFSRRKAYEDKVFGPDHRLPTMNKPPVLRIKKGELNSPATVNLLNRFHPGLIALFGTGILREKILSLFPERIFNLHVGLPQHFRGSSCNFWPVHENQLDKLGAAVHLTNQGIDLGEIAAQTRIAIEDQDDEQTLAGKTLIAGAQLMISTIRHWQQGRLNFSPVLKPGKLYLMKDFTPAAVLRIRQMVESGELQDRLKKVCKKKQSPK